MKKESALKELFIKTSSETKSNIEEQCRKIYKKKLDVFLTLRKFNSKHKNEKIVKKFELIEQNSESLKDLNNYIPKFLTYLWEDPKIMSNFLLHSDIKDIKKVIAPLLANNFYENILSFNYLQENFMFVLTLLCKEEISNLSSSNNINSFLQDSPCGCLLEQLINKIDIKSYFNRILKDVIENIEIKCSERKMNFLIDVIEEQIKDKRQKKIKKVNKGKNKKQEEEDDVYRKNPTENIKFNIGEIMSFNSSTLDDNDPDESGTREKIDKESSKLFSEKYTPDLCSKDFKEKIEEYNNDLGMQNYFKFQLKFCETQDDYFSNKTFLKKVFESKYSTILLNEYQLNFMKVIIIIKEIFTKLLKDLHLLPYSVKCICKIILLLIRKQFPDITITEENAFVAKFFFCKVFAPIFLNPSTGALINNFIISGNTVHNLSIILDIIKQLVSGRLYREGGKHGEFTPFNWFFMEEMPLVLKFFENLTKVELPTFIDNFIKDKLNEDYVYDYFKENPDEIMRLQGVCFSISDVLYILKLIKDQRKKFKNLPRYDYFNKTVERILCDDYKLEEQEKEKANIFFIVYRDERNTQLEQLFKSKKNNQTTFFTEGESDSDPSLICSRIKFCIKNILKNVELNFPYLEKSTSTDKFFSAIYYELDEDGENTEIIDKVPIKWYSQYIYENKNNLDLKYRKNDFQLLYEEILEEENNKLIELKNITSKLITKNNINLKCAEELLNRMNFSLEDILEEKKIAKIEKFIDTEEIKVCILTTKNEGQKIKIRNAKDCDLITNENHIETEKNKKIILCHANYIKDFISKFSYNNWEDINRPPPIKLIKEDIQKGNRDYKIYQTFKDYMDIIKKKIKAPVNNPNLFNDITDIGEILDKIEDYILQQIYKYSYSPLKFKEETIFYQKLKSYGWITPSMLDIKNISIKQLDYTKKCIENLDNAFSVNDKLNCIRDAHASLNNAIKFSTGNDSDAGQDEITPIFQYVIIQAKPERIIFNINYIKTFLDESELSGSKGFLVTQIESATSYINAINHETLKISEEEFRKNIDKWSKLNG